VVVAIPAAGSPTVPAAALVTRRRPPGRPAGGLGKRGKKWRGLEMPPAPVVRVVESLPVESTDTT